MRIGILGLVFGLAVSPVLADDHKRSGNQGGDRFAAADSNGDWGISRSEFLAIAEKRFDKMDADGNGSLSKDEMRPPRRSGYGRR